ncbi:hypothetical protein RHMOL_Rhmol09G0175900 [Rhododendron molle]|uniref:Uncharacterized protein n=1 Tax=Rhododendron molle TaxID=49168 RepID=A0ACC0MGA7_RHOML|nr:hypothetical protein RHMOL_Rhmol09G0175900 [Rhododendron molle]
MPGKYLTTRKRLKKLFGDGLGTSKGEKRAKQRKLDSHAFYAESLKNMVPAMTQSVEMMLEWWKHHEGKQIENMVPAMTQSVEMMLEWWKHHEGKQIEVFEEFMELTSEVISRTAFGSSYLEGRESDI